MQLSQLLQEFSAPINLYRFICSIVNNQDEILAENAIVFYHNKKLCHISTSIMITPFNRPLFESQTIDYQLRQCYSDHIIINAFFQNQIIQYCFLYQMKLSGKQLKLVNRGSNSFIFRYGNQDKSVIIKAVPKKYKKECRHLFNEYRMLSSLEHENIIKALKYKQNICLHGIGSTYNQNDNQTIAEIMVLENANHGSLLEFYKKYEITPGQVRWIFGELCEAVRFLHCNYLVHRDLKLENAMVIEEDSEFRIKLGDFGYCYSTKSTAGSNLSSSIKGTKRGYMAPEIHSLLQDPTLSYDMYKSDIFALGIMLFSLVLGRLPFEYATSQNQYFNLIASGRTEEFWKIHNQKLGDLEQGHQFESDFKELFISMTQPDPSKRLSIDQVFKFEWMKGRQQLILPSLLIQKQ